MRVRRLFAGSVAVALVQGVAQAQGGTIDAQCRGGSAVERITQDACQKAIDLFTFMAPQLGGGLTGGNAISGEHSVIGRAGHTSLGIRFNVVQARLPKIDDISPAITGAVASEYAIKDQAIPIPTIDAALGLFRGVPIGGSYAFGVDALLNLSILPSMTVGDLEVSVPDGPVKLGVGARVSLVTESVLTPGITFTYLKRDLPHVAVKGTPGSDEIDIDDFQVKTSAWRGVIGKNFGVLSIAGGFGQDTYKTSTLATVRITRLGVTTSAGPIVATQRLTRDNAFGSLALNFGLLSIVGEGGRASGGDLTTYNTFGSDLADDLSTFGIGAELDEAQWRAVLRQLITLRLVAVDHDKFNVLRLTAASREVLKGQRSLTLRVDAAPANGARRSRKTRSTGATPDIAGFASPRGEAVFQALREWRRGVAREHNVPAYTILHDSSLREIANRLPEDPAALHGIAGIGAVKLERYGAALIDVVRGG